MARSVAIFGTPDGFDSLGAGDAALSSNDVIRKFEALSFTSLDVPLGTSAWGLFKRTDTDGIIIGIGKLIRAREFSEARPGGYVGSGFLLRNQSAPALDVVIAIQELSDAVAASAFGERPFRFVASKISDLPRIDIPESCKTLTERLVDCPPPNPLADASINRVYISGERTEVLRVLLSNQDKFSTINVLFAEAYDLSAPAAAGGLTVVTAAQFEEWAIAAEIDIRRREQAARQKAAEEARLKIAEEARQRIAEEARQKIAEEATRTRQASSTSSYGRSELPRANREPEYPPQGREDGSTFRPDLNRRKARASDEASLTWFTYRGWLLLLVVSVVSSALISILATIAIVRDPGLEARYRDAQRRLADARADVDELRASTQRLESELKALRASSGDPAPKFPIAKEVPKSERERGQSEKLRR